MGLLSLQKKNPAIQAFLQSHKRGRQHRTFHPLVFVVSEASAISDGPAIAVVLEGLVVSHFAIPALTLANSFLLALLEGFVVADSAMPVACPVERLPSRNAKPSQ